MRKSVFAAIILLAIASVTLVAYINSIYNDSIQPTSNNTLFADVNDNSFITLLHRKSLAELTLEVAQTPRKRAQGLMFREELAPNSGMFFLFNREQPLSFWMKDTSVSLDIIFLNSELKVTTISSNTKTNQTTEIYTAKVDSQYVIETIAGWALEHDVQVGDYFDIISSK
ncbi:hypothetical protein DOJK_02005 [Patescibacteria group bacterium]|nr:hypothetical protein DOJK_02005 [Patescibacteria group bacterium]